MVMIKIGCRARHATRNSGPRDTFHGVKRHTQRIKSHETCKTLSVYASICYKMTLPGQRTLDVEDNDTHRMI